MYASGIRHSSKAITYSRICDSQAMPKTQAPHSIYMNSYIESKLRRLALFNISVHWSRLIFREEQRNMRWWLQRKIQRRKWTVCVAGRTAGRVLEDHHVRAKKQRICKFYRTVMVVCSLQSVWYSEVVVRIIKSWSYLISCYYSSRVLLPYRLSLLACRLRLAIIFYNEKYNWNLNAGQRSSDFTSLIEDCSLSAR